MSAPVENLVSRLHAKRSGKGWIAKCPAHDDHTPSLSIDEGADGRALFKCHAGCDNTAILASLGMKPRDLFPATISTRTAAAQHRTSTAASTFDWHACVDALTPRDLVRLGNERWWSRAFCLWLHEKKFIGLHSGCFLLFRCAATGRLLARTIASKTAGGITHGA
jgi:hypothetical protein